MQVALFGTDPSTYTVERCTPTRPFYIPGECCVLRYQFQARHGTSGQVLKPIVTGRVFPNHAACARYMREKLAGPAARMRGRPEVAAFAAPAVMIDSLNMVVQVWPVDGELPMLVDATDRGRMIDVFREMLSETPDQQFAVTDCHIERVSYRRRQRCVLRYTIAGTRAGRDEFLIMYGKLTPAGYEPLESRMIDALRDHIVQRGAADRVTLPRSFGWRPELQLLLLDALPGEALIAPALKARLRGDLPSDGLRLEEMIETCGYAAAMLHTSELHTGRIRTLDAELAELQRETAMLRQFVPDFSDRVESWLERIAVLAEHSEPLRLCLSHGDFKHEQFLFDGARSGLLDFDTVCLAEPALDVGKFVACLRVGAERIQKRAPVPRLVEQLAERFVRAYINAMGEQLHDEQRWRQRVTLYEALGLVRIALLSQRNLDDTGVEVISDLVNDRLQ